MGSQQQQQEFCLKWNNHQSNMLTVFDNLLASESFVDVTIACDGFILKAHKVVLSACSPYFRKLLEDNPCQHPIVILADVRHDEMRAIIEFMYKGEVNVTQEQLSTLLKTAETLKVKGLTEVNNVPQGNDAPPPLPPLPQLAPSSIGASASNHPPYRLGSGKRPTSTSQPPTSKSSSSLLSPPSPSCSKRRRKPGTSGCASKANPRPSCSSSARQKPPEDVESGKSIVAELLQTVKQEPVACTDDQTDANDFTIDAAPSELLLDADNGINYSNQDFLSVCSEKTPNLVRFDDGVDDGQVDCQGIVAASASTGAVQENVSNSSVSVPSTSTAEKKPKEKKKTSWTVTDLMRAIESVRSGRMNVLKAAMTFKIPKSSLYDYVNGRSGARLRLMKRIQPLEAMRVLGASKEYVARALPFLNPEAAAILASGDMSWPIPRMRLPPDGGGGGAVDEHHRGGRTFSEYFSSSAAEDFRDDDEDGDMSEHNLLAVREMCSAGMSVASEEIIASLPNNIP